MWLMLRRSFSFKFLPSLQPNPSTGSPVRACKLQTNISETSQRIFVLTRQPIPTLHCLKTESPSFLKSAIRRNPQQ